MRRIVITGLVFYAFGGVLKGESEQADLRLIGTHVVSTPPEVRFVDAEGKPLGKVRGGTVLDVLSMNGEMLQVARGWIKRRDVVPQQDAIEFFTQQLRDKPTAIGYASRARVWNYRGEYDKAIDDCDEGLRLDSDCATAYDRRGQALTAKGRIDEALADFDRAVALTPNYASTYSFRARAWLEKGDLEKALADCDAALNRDPAIYLAHYIRGRVWTRQKAAAKAIASYGRAIELNPHHVPSLNARGNEWFGQGKFAEAEADYSAAIPLDPEFDIVHVHYNRGNARLRQGKVELAKADYQEALKHDEAYLPAMQGVAACFAAQKDYQAAIDWQARAVKLAKAEQKARLKSVLTHYQAAQKK